MRRTTIFRSSRAAAVAATLVVAAAATSARDVRAQTPTQLPEVHVVQTGETLWALAERYLGDPFLWPEIYRINTSVVEDPHWIFPGEELRLLMPVGVVEVVEVIEETEPGAPDTVQVEAGQLPRDPVDAEQIPVPPTPVAPAPPPTETAPTIFQNRGPSIRSLDMTAPIFRYRPVRRGQFYSAGFLTEGDEFPWAKVLGATGTPTLSTLTGSSQARIFGSIDIEAPESATYEVGDSILTVRIMHDVQDGWGQVVRPSGIARVTNVSGSRVRAEVISQFGRVADGQFALPLERFNDPGDVAPVPIENGAESEILAVRSIHPIRQQQNVVFIGLGREDGISLGDVFEVYRSASDDPLEIEGEAVGILNIVHVRNRSASGFVVNVMDLGLDAGAPVRLIRKMPG